MINWVSIYTTSAFHCKYCIEAKELLNIYGIDFYEKDIHLDETYRKEFIDGGHTKVPQIYIEETLIGGCDSLKEYLRRNHSTKAKKEAEAYD